jgi:5-methylcytosine-specific restriction protein B
MKMFTWIPLYKEIARHVLAHESRQGELIAVLRRLREQGLPVILLADRGRGGGEIELREIDPFTFFSSFNRGQTFFNRIKILDELKRLWGLRAEIPTQFEGIPVVDNRRSWFFLYDENRGPDDVPKLWRLAKETVEKDPSNFNRQVLDDCLAVGMGSLPMLTMGMFWLNPYNYLAVDSRNRKYLERFNIRLKGRTAGDYFQLLREVKANFEDDFATISHRAYLSTIGKGGGGGAEPPQPSQETRFWTLSAGEGGRWWPEFQDEGVIGIGWERTSDLTKFRDREELRQKMLELWPEQEGAQTNDSLACWQFAREMKPGDIVFAKQGQAKLLGVGRVTGDYAFVPERPTFLHVRKVEWISEGGPWDLPEDSRVALKTLTDVSPYREFLERVASLTGVPLPLPKAKAGGTGQPEPPPPDRRYWWLNANPKIWNFESKAVGEKQTYTSHNERGNKRQKYKYFGEVKPGDLVIGYVTSPQKEVIAVCEITRGLHESGGAERIEFQKVEQLQNPVTYDELKAVPALARSEPLVNNQGSLFALSEEEYEIIRAVIDEKNPPVPTAALKPYTKRDALSELFLSERELDDIISRLRRKKNVILQGPPGVGKTYVARRLAFLMLGVKDSSRVQMVQFHQSYAYEDFIQGYRPNEDGRFTIKPGVFYEFCRKAQRDPGREYFFVIDEINRGNLSKIFGELMMLIEHDKRGPGFAIPLTYSRSGDDLFHIPDNLYLIGMMNTADRSLSLVDYALRRRFAFVTLHPKFASERFAETLAEAGASRALVHKIRERVGLLNKEIADDERNLGPGYQIGHSYFCPGPDGRPLDEAWYREVIESEIRPLLEEYWVDESGKVGDLVSRLLD